MEDQKWRPRHLKGLDVRPQALENTPLSQNGHPQPEEDHQVPAQLHHVQAVSEAVFRNDREPGPVGEDKLFVTRHGRCAVSSGWANSDGWRRLFLGPLKRPSGPFHIDGGNEDTPKHSLCIKTIGDSE